MAVFIKGKTFTSTEQVTSTKLHQLVDSGTFDTGAVDGVTTALSGGAIIVKDGGINSAKLASGLTVVHATGSAAAPSVTSTGDTDSGLYFASNQVNVSLNGIQTIAFTGGSYPALEMAGPSGAFVDLSVGTINSPDFSLRTLADINGGHLYVSGNKPLALYTNALERMRVTGSGDVGIGTASPASKLHVSGDITATGFLGNLTGNVTGNVTGSASTVSDGSITGAKLSSTVAIPTGATAVTQAVDTNTTAVATTAFAKKEADDAQAFAIQRANHTGTQAAGTITGLGALATTGTAAQICKAWCNFDGQLTGTNAPRSGYNVSSVTRNSVGNYTVTFTSAMGDSNYCVIGSAQDPVSGQGNCAINIVSISTGSFIVKAQQGAVNASEDSGIVCVTVFAA